MSLRHRRRASTSNNTSKETDAPLDLSQKLSNSVTARPMEEVGDERSGSNGYTSEDPDTGRRRTHADATLVRLPLNYGFEQFTFRDHILSGGADRPASGRSAPQAFAVMSFTMHHVGNG